jgi:ABC-type spermidine/putrescine transport system permease subunit I
VIAAAKRLLVAFGAFWWEFLIGENPDAFFGAIVVIGTALLLRHERAAAIIVVPFLTILILVTSTYRGRKRTSN